MSVLACSRRARVDEDFVGTVAPMEGLDDLLSRSDFVLTACPLTPETNGLLDAARLAKMKPSAVVINIARGPVIDEDALYAACRDHIIAGAVIDVWYRYPASGENICMPSNLPFHELDNVILSPHSSGLGEGLVRRRWQAMTANLNALARGLPLANVIRAPGGSAPE
jgi:phosphoglycerate dehydrogenase-like enzyme